MTPRERRIYHRQYERRHSSAARGYIRWKNYSMAAVEVVLAMQHATAANCAAAEEMSAKIKKARAGERIVPAAKKTR